MAPKKIAVILTGCGRMDGSEVHESTLTLLYLAQAGATCQCFAPNEPQREVRNHLSGEVTAERRNQMVEAARIARGAVRPLNDARSEDFDGLILPGGSGSYGNLHAADGSVNADLRRLLVEMADAGKPIGAICIAPILISEVLGERGVSLTIGNSAEDANKIRRNGARHVECIVRECVIDEAHRVVSTPAYMLGPGIADIAAGIQKCVQAVVDLCGK